MQKTGSLGSLGSSEHPQVMGFRGLPLGHSDCIQMGRSGGQPQVLGSRASPFGHNDCMHIGFPTGSSTRVSVRLQRHYS